MLQGAPVAEVFRLAWPVSKTTRMSSVSRGYSSIAPGGWDHPVDGVSGDRITTPIYIGHLEWATTKVTTYCIKLLETRERGEVLVGA